jgi:hypothetical protein
VRESSEVWGNEVSLGIHTDMVELGYTAEMYGIRV